MSARLNIKVLFEIIRKTWYQNGMSGLRVSDRTAEDREKRWKKFGAAIAYPYL